MSMRTYVDSGEELLGVWNVLDAVSGKDVVERGLFELIDERVGDRVLHSCVLLLVKSLEGDGEHIRGEVDSVHMDSELVGDLSGSSSDSDSDVKHLLIWLELSESLDDLQVLLVSSGRDEVLSEHPFISVDSSVCILGLVKEITEGDGGIAGCSKRLLPENKDKVEEVLLNEGRVLNLIDGVQVESGIATLGVGGSENIKVVGQTGNLTLLSIL